MAEENQTSDTAPTTNPTEITGPSGPSGPLDSQGIDTGPSGPSGMTTPASDDSDSPSPAFQTEEFTKAVKEIVSKETDARQIRYIEVLGIFAALFTFVSINIQILSKVNTLNNAIVFSGLLSLCLIDFVYFLHLSLRLAQDEKNNWSFFLFAVTIFLIIVFVLVFIRIDPISI